MAIEIATRARTERDIVSLVAAFGLDGSREWPERPVPGDAWRAVAGDLRSQKLMGLALAAADAGALAVGEDQQEEIASEHRDRMGWALLLERNLLSIVDALEAAGIPTIVLKGPSFAHTAYPDPSWREFGDIDLLVPTDRFASAGEVLRSRGLQLDVPAPRPGFVERFGKAAVYRAEAGFEVDLHRTLVIGPYSMWVEPERLFDAHVTFTLGGRSLRCLSAEHRLIHACMHAVLGARPPLLVPIRDAAQIARAEGADLGVIEADVRAWKLEAVMDAAARLVRDHLGVVPGEALGRFEGRRPTRLQRKVLASYTGPGRDAGATASSMMRAIPGFVPKLAYLRAVVFPDREFVARRTGIRESRWRAYRRRWRLLARALLRRRAARRRAIPNEGGERP